MTLDIIIGLVAFVIAVTAFTLNIWNCCRTKRLKKERGDLYIENKLAKDRNKIFRESLEKEREKVLKLSLEIQGLEAKYKATDAAFAAASKALNETRKELVFTQKELNGMKDRREFVDKPKVVDCCVRDEHAVECELEELKEDVLDRLKKKLNIKSSYNPKTFQHFIECSITVLKED